MIETDSNSRLFIPDPGVVDVYAWSVCAENAEFVIKPDASGRVATTPFIQGFVRDLSVVVDGAPYSSPLTFRVHHAAKDGMTFDVMDLSGLPVFSPIPVPQLSLAWYPLESELLKGQDHYVTYASNGISLSMCIDGNIAKLISQTLKTVLVDEGYEMQLQTQTILPSRISYLGVTSADRLQGVRLVQPAPVNPAWRVEEVLPLGFTAENITPSCTSTEVDGDGRTHLVWEEPAGTFGRTLFSYDLILGGGPQTDFSVGGTVTVNGRIVPFSGNFSYAKDVTFFNAITVPTFYFTAPVLHPREVGLIRLWGVSPSEITFSQSLTSVVGDAFVAFGLLSGENVNEYEDPKRKHIRPICVTSAPAGQASAATVLSLTIRPRSNSSILGEYRFAFFRTSDDGARAILNFANREITAQGHVTISVWCNEDYNRSAWKRQLQAGEYESQPLLTPDSLTFGYNTDFVRAGDLVQLQASPSSGRGAKVALSCGTDNAPQGIKPDSDGNIIIQGDSCYPITTDVSTDSLIMFGECDACCKCSDYVDALLAIQAIGTRWTGAWDGLDLVKGKYDTALSDYKKVLTRQGTMRTYADATTTMTVNESATVVTATTKARIRLSDPNVRLRVDPVTGKVISLGSDIRKVAVSNLRITYPDLGAISTEKIRLQACSIDFDTNRTKLLNTAEIPTAIMDGVLPAYGHRVIQRDNGSWWPNYGSIAELSISNGYPKGKQVSILPFIVNDDWPEPKYPLDAVFLLSSLQISITLTFDIYLTDGDTTICSSQPRPSGIPDLSAVVQADLSVTLMKPDGVTPSTDWPYNYPLVEPTFVTSLQN